ncbi:MAG: lipoyl(octanoyl) transferase LipB [Gemmatimonadota bacterium]
MARVVWRDLGLVPYDEALELQRELAKAKREGIVRDDILLLLEHPPVITRGRSASVAHLVTDKSTLDDHGVSVHEIERGGDVTYHGPGQLVGYPIFDLRRFREDLHWYLRSLEEVLILTLGSLDVGAARAEGLTGVWVGPGVDERELGPDRSIDADSAPEMMRSGHIRKIASIGVHASRWITKHGFALNHGAEALEGFEWIVPCGLDGVTVTSLESEGCRITMDELKRRIVRGFESVFEVTIRASDADEI